MLYDGNHDSVGICAAVLVVISGAWNLVVYNTVVTAGLLYIEIAYPAYFPKISPAGFTIVGTLLSFLLVSRVGQGLGKYHAGRQMLSNIHKGKGL